MSSRASSGGGVGRVASVLGRLAVPLAALVATLAMLHLVYKATVVPALKHLSRTLDSQTKVTLGAAGKGYSVKGGSGTVYSPEDLQEKLSGFDPSQKKMGQRSVASLMAAYGQAANAGEADRAGKILERVRDKYGDQAAAYVDIMSIASTTVAGQQVKDQIEANGEMEALERQAAANKAQAAAEAGAKAMGAANSLLAAQREVAELRGDSSAVALGGQLIAGLQSEAEAYRAVGNEQKALAKESEALTMEMERQNSAREKSLGLMDSQVGYYQSQVELLKAQGAGEGQLRQANLNVARAQFGRAGAIQQDLGNITDPEERFQAMAELNRAKAAGLQIQNQPMLEGMKERQRQQERLQKKFGPMMGGGMGGGMGLQHNVRIDPQTVQALAQNPGAADRMGMYMSKWARETFAGQAAMGGAW